MPPEEKERSRYFQEIAAVFFRERGGPFLLSPKDMATIASWESLGVPLEAACEGVVRAFEHNRTGRPDARRTIRSLAGCQSQVLKAFELFRDRRVGRPVKTKSRDQKRAAMIVEARRFLDLLPGEMVFLKAPFERALGLLEKDQPDEEALERLESEIERLLIAHAPAGDMADIRRTWDEGSPSKGEGAAADAFNIKVLKSLRAKYRIPYITFHYY